MGTVPDQGLSLARDCPLNRYLLQRPVRSIVEALGRLSRLWLKKGYPYRKKAVHRLVSRSGFTAPMAQAMLDALFRELTAPKLWALLKTELGDPRVLDEFRRDPVSGNRVRARGPEFITHVFSANVPNPSILSFVFGMLVKSANVGKLSARDEGFLDIYLDSLRSLDPKLAGVNSLIPPGRKDILEKVLKISKAVVAYGQNETLEELRAQVPSAAFFGYGHRVSFGLYTRGALAERSVRALAMKTARDVWMMDQRGCLSPVTVYVQKGGGVTPFRFSAMLAEKLEKLSAGERKVFPLTRILGSESVKDIFKIKKIKGEKIEMWEPRRKGAWLVAYDEKPGAAAWLSGGQRVTVKAFGNVREVFRVLPLLRNSLQAVALEALGRERAALAERLSALGVNRVCRAGKMQEPPIFWHHDGRPNLAEWVTWTDLED